MHLNVKHQQWKCPINVICTTFPCVGFVGLKFPISTSIHGFLQNFPVIEGGDFEKTPPVRLFRTDQYAIWGRCLYLVNPGLNFSVLVCVFNPYTTILRFNKMIVCCMHS